VEKCNLPKELAAAGSATALVPWEDTAARMCDVWKDLPDGSRVPDLDVAGCAQMRSGTSLTDEQKAKMKGDGSTNSASGGVAPSIEVPKGHTAGVVAHEAQGHSQMGKPNGAVHGNGIG